MTCNNVDLPPLPEQEKEFTVGWVKWLRKIYDAIKVLQSCITDTNTNIDSIDSSITTIEDDISTINSSLSTLESSVSTLGIRSIQTGYEAPGTGSTGSGEDGKYKDITITAVADIANCVIQIEPLLDASGIPTIQTARLTSTTNLRLSRNDVSHTTVGGRWTVIEYCSIGCGAGQG